MCCKASSRTGHTVSRVNIGYAVADRDHRSGAAVPRHLRLVKAASHRLYGRDDTVSPRFVDHLAHEVWTRPGFFPKTLAGELSRTSFRAGRYDGSRDTHQDASG